MLCLLAKFGELYRHLSVDLLRLISSLSRSWEFFQNLSLIGEEIGGKSPIIASGSNGGLAICAALVYSSHDGQNTQLRNHLLFYVGSRLISVQ
jgi:hypothetical protein